MIDNQEPQVHSEVNTIFTEERALISESAKHQTTLSIPNYVEDRMPDSTWLAKTQLSKPVMIGQYTWDMSQKRGAMIASFDFPEVLVTKDSLMNRTLRMYSFYRITPIVRLQLNATQFHQGQLILTFDPFAQATEVENWNVNKDTPICNIYYATGLPNVKLMASEADPVELKIPFVHPRNYLTTNSSNGFDLMGRVRLQVLNPLKAASGATSSLTATIWIYANDASVHVPMNYHDPMIPDLLYATPSGLLESVSGIIGEGTDLVGNIISGNFKPALSNGRGLVNKIGDIFGFDYPTMPVHLDKTISPVENLAITKGISRSHRLAMDPKSGYIPPPDMFNELDIDLLRIAQTPMLFAQLKWDTTNELGTQLMDVHISPCCVPGEVYMDTSAYYLTYLSFVSSLFTYWRGGIIYDLEFVATHYHSGRLAVGFVPNDDRVNGSYEDIVTACPNTIIDIQQTSKVSFLIPFVSATPIKHTNAGPIDESLIGHLKLYVQNKLAMSNNVDSSIEINVYVRAAPDFQLFVPRDPSLRFTAYPKAEPSTGIELQSNRTEDASKSTPVQLTLGNGLSPVLPKFAESYSLLDLIRRFTFSRSLALPVYTGSTPIHQDKTVPTRFVTPYYSDLYQETGSLPQNQSESYLSYISRIYSIWSGSLRFKYVFPESRTSQTGFTVLHCPPWAQFAVDIGIGTQNYAALSGYATTLTTLSQDNCLEIEVPYYSEYQCLLTRPPADMPYTPYKTPMLNGALLISPFSPTEQQPIGSYEYIAAGDDFRFAYLRPPGINYNATQFSHNYHLD